MCDFVCMLRFSSVMWQKTYLGSKLLQKCHKALSCHCSTIGTREAARCTGASQQVQRFVVARAGREQKAGAGTWQYAGSQLLPWQCRAASGCSSLLSSVQPSEVVQNQVDSLGLLQPKYNFCIQT